MQKFSAFPVTAAPAPVISQKVPVYKLMKPYFDKNDSYCPEGTFIQLKSEPNEWMEPQNALAEVEMRKFLTKLDNIATAKVDDIKPLTRLEQYEAEKKLKASMVRNDDEEEGVVNSNPSNTDVPLSILGAKKYKVGADEYTTDKRKAK